MSFTFCRMKFVYCTLLFSISALSISFAQNKLTPAYQVKAVFLYNFTRFVDWPSTTFTSPQDTFTIGILGKDPFGSYIDETVTGEKLGTHPIKIERYENLKDLINCQILYINIPDQEYVKSILAATSKLSILTVSDEPDFNRWGGMVRFFTESNKIRLEINTNVSKAAQLEISSKLLSVAKSN